MISSWLPAWIARPDTRPRRVLPLLLMGAVLLIAACHELDGLCDPDEYARSDLLWDITAGDAGFVAVGNSGAVATSRDGIHWQRRQAPTGATLRGITFADSRYVAVGAAQSIFVSTDGVDWSECGVAGPAMLGGVAHGDAEAPRR